MAVQPVKRAVDITAPITTDLSLLIPLIPSLLPWLGSPSISLTEERPPIQVKETIPIMATSEPNTGEFPVSTLSTRHPTRFNIVPSDAERQAIMETLGLSNLRKLRFVGEIEPKGRKGWTLKATLGATVVQPCIVTLEPVTTRIDETVVRRFELEEDLPEAGSEMEMPEDDTVELVPEVISAHGIMIESLSLALPAYPRAESAELGEAVFAEKGIVPMSEEDIKPFAGLKSLRDALEKPSDD